jgi:TonB-dependent SusC/RagA subfamily outer membrane receptor
MTSRVFPTLAGLLALVLAACARQPKGTPRPTPDTVDIGYGTQRKDKVTGAVSTISEQQISARPLRIQELLQGKVAGLQVVQNGSNVTFRIRGGAGSLLADQEPLVIVDGQMIQAGNIANALAGLTPDDIKQVSVLKDVASTSIYGGRGAGGVILITTKTRSPPENDGG